MSTTVFDQQQVPGGGGSGGGQIICVTTGTSSTYRVRHPNLPAARDMPDGFMITILPHVDSVTGPVQLINDATSEDLGTIYFGSYNYGTEYDIGTNGERLRTGFAYNIQRMYGDDIEFGAAWITTNHGFIRIEDPARVIGTLSVAHGGTGQDNLDQLGSYSTNGFVTPYKWIDGKPIWKQTVSVGPLPGNSGDKAVTIPFQPNIDTIVSITGNAKSTSPNEQISFPYPHPTFSSAISVTVENNDTIRIRTGTDQTRFATAYVTLHYTKTQ